MQAAVEVEAAEVAEAAVAEAAEAAAAMEAEDTGMDVLEVEVEARTSGGGLRAVSPMAAYLAVPTEAAMAETRAAVAAQSSA